MATGRSDRRLWVGRRHVWKGRGTPAQVRGRHCQYGDLELDSLRDVQPMEAGQRVGDVVGSPQVIDQSRSRVQHWLESPDQVDREASQGTVTSPNELAQGWPPVSGTCRSAVCDGSGAACGGWQNTAKPFAGPHHRVDIYIDSYIASGPQGLNQSAVNWRSWTRKQGAGASIPQRAGIIPKAVFWGEMRGPKGWNASN